MLIILYFAAVAGILFLGLRMACGPCVAGRPDGSGGVRIPVIALGWALSLFLALTYAVCVAFDVILPKYAMYKAWAPLLPGFVWLTLPGFLIGLVESFLYGWYVALVFGGLFNAIANRGGRNDTG